MRRSWRFLAALLLAIVGAAHYWHGVYQWQGGGIDWPPFSPLHARYWWTAAFVMTLVSIANREPTKWISAVLGVGMLSAILWLTVLSLLPPL